MEAVNSSTHLDLERDRQARRRLGARSEVAGGDEGLPAEPPDQRTSAAEARRHALVELRPDHRSGRLVRSARAHREGRAGARSATAFPARSRLGADRMPDELRYGQEWSTMTMLPATTQRQKARAGHRPRCLRRLPCLRGQLQGMEHRRLRRGALGPGSLWRRRLGHFPQSHPHFRGRAGRRRDRRRGGRGAHRAFPEILPALRRRALRHRLPDRRLLQARRGRHRAGRRGQVHRLRALRLGLPLWRARDGSGGRRHEEMHAVHRPHLQRDASRRSTACRPACAPARPMPAITATLPIPRRRCRSWWPSAAVWT